MRIFRFTHEQRLRQLEYRSDPCVKSVLLKIRIFGMIQEACHVFGNVMLIFGQRGQFFPIGIAAKGLPVGIPVRFIFKGGHVHQIWHRATRHYLSVKDCVEAQSFKQAYFIPVIKHPDLVGGDLFRVTLIAPQFVNPVFFGSLQTRNGVVWMFLKGVHQNSFNSGKRWIGIGCIQVVCTRRLVALILGKF